MTVGVEEEFFIVDPRTRDLAVEGLPGIDNISDRLSIGTEGCNFDHEFQLSIIESRTGVCGGLEQIRIALEELRRRLAGAAADAELRILAAGTMPLAEWRTARITPKPRYEQIAAHYCDVVRRRATCGLHVHVGVADREVAVQVLNRIRRWLPLLLALSASSPFYEGADTGYASFRWLLWGGFPVAGIPGYHRSYEDYAITIQRLIDTGLILDAGHVYWDARLGTKYDTLEFRIADACTTIDEAILQAGLCRALVLTCMNEVTAGRPIPTVRSELLRAATWRAARSGLDNNVIDVVAAEPVAPTEMLARLLTYLRDALDELGDWDEIVSLLDQARDRGTSCRRQHCVLARTGRLEDVVDALATETASGASAF